jgi:hypothetical protein
MLFEEFPFGSDDKMAPSVMTGDANLGRCLMVMDDEGA